MRRVTDENRIIGRKAARPVLLVFGVLAANMAIAQSQAPPSSSPSALRKQNVTANPQVFGDWQLRCQSLEGPARSNRSCELVQAVLQKGQATPFAQIAVGRPSADDSLSVTVVVPTNADFASGPRIAASDADTQPLELIWRRCAPGGCFASLPMRDEAVKRWRMLDTLGRVTFKNASGQDVALPISFRGLARGLDALGKER